jgi:hypothetical protein
VTSYGCRVQDLGGDAGTSAAAASTGKSEKQLLKQYSQVYDKLQEHGFSQGQIQQVLQELPQVGATPECGKLQLLSCVGQ